MRERPSWDAYFLTIAYVVAQRSPDEETQVGCVITDVGHRILSCGYNGFPPGFPDEQLPAKRPEKYPYMVHAETNAIASTRQDLRGAVLYTTHSPCGDCVKAIITAGICKIICAQFYPNADFDHVLEMCGFAGVEMYFLNNPIAVSLLNFPKGEILRAIRSSDSWRCVPSIGSPGRNP